jgi:hypothetical protein
MWHFGQYNQRVSHTRKYGSHLRYRSFIQHSHSTVGVEARYRLAGVVATGVQY